jgi:hypothetical protein
MSIAPTCRLRHALQLYRQRLIHVLAALEDEASSSRASYVECHPARDDGGCEHFVEAIGWPLRNPVA